MAKDKKEITERDQLSEFLLYTTPNGDVKVEIIIFNETVWLTQKRMAELFGVDISTINEHLKNIYKTEELDEEATIGKFPIVQMEGNRDKSKEMLSLIISMQCYQLDIGSIPARPLNFEYGQLKP